MGDSNTKLKQYDFIELTADEVSVANSRNCTGLVSMLGEKVRGVSGDLVFDLKGVNDVPSTVFGMIVRVAQELKDEKKGQVYFINAKPRHYEFLDLTGMLQLVKVCATRDEYLTKWN